MSTEKFDMKSESMVFIPSIQTFVYAAEGDGGNLSAEDEAEGAVDYLYIETYIYEDRELVEYDGGQLNLSEMFVDKYHTEDEYIKDAIRFMFDADLDYIVIETPEYAIKIN